VCVRVNGFANFVGSPFSDANFLDLVLAKINKLLLVLTSCPFSISDHSVVIFSAILKLHEVVVKSCPRFDFQGANYEAVECALSSFSY
jgi:hypothetical protein